MHVYSKQISFYGAYELNTNSKTILVHILCKKFNLLSGSGLWTMCFYILVYCIALFSYVTYILHTMFLFVQMYDIFVAILFMECIIQIVLCTFHILNIFLKLLKLKTHVSQSGKSLHLLLVAISMTSSSTQSKSRLHNTK